MARADSIGIVGGEERSMWSRTKVELVLNRAFTGKVFISTPEDTGPAYTQMKLQHRSRAP